MLAWSAELRKRAGRPNPAIRVIVEAEVVANADSKHRRDHWLAADSTLGLRILDDGRLTLSAVTSTLISYATGTAQQTALQRTTGAFVGSIEWGGTEPHSMTISSITARLDPNADGSGKVVNEWAMQLFTPVRELEDAGEVELTPICQKVRVTAGASAADVEFAFPAGAEPRPKARGAMDGDASSAPLSTVNPVTIVWIWAIDADGNAAGNVAWIADSAGSEHTSGGETLRSHRLVSTSAGDAWTVQSVTAIPRMSVVQQTFSAATATFSGAANKLDLGAPPTGDVRFAFTEQTPGPTSVTYEVLDDAGTTWVPVASGQTTDDLAGVGKRQTYAVRATLDPGSPANQTPAVISIAVQEVELVDFDGLAKVEVTGWQVDPTTGKGSICEATISALMDGNRDYRDAATSLVANHSVNDIAFRVWTGWKDSDGKIQGRIRDIFDIDDHTGEGAARRFVCVGRNARLANVALPVYDTAAQRREKLAYENQTLKAVWDDILTNQIALDDRFIGPGVEDATTQVTKQIKDSDAITELDAIAYLAGGSVVSSQGRVRFVKLHEEEGREVVQVFRREDIQPGPIGPGLRSRVPEFYVPWDYDFGTGDFLREHQALSTNALTAFDPWRIDGPRSLDSEVAKWIDTPELAATVGSRVVETQATGLIVWRFRSLYPTPLEPGDVVAVPTDRFAARDPNVSRALRGHLYAIGRIVRVGDVMGRDLMLWVQSYADIRASTTQITRTGFAVPEVLNISAHVDAVGDVRMEVTGNAQTGGFRIATSTTGPPSLATTQAAAVVAATDHVYTSGVLATLAYDEELYIAVIAAENGSSPHGAEQLFVSRATARQNATNDLDLIDDGVVYQKVRGAVLSDGRIRFIRRSGGADVDADNAVIVNESITRLAGRIAANIEYGTAGSGTTIESLKPAEVGAEKNPAAIKNASHEVSDDGLADNYSSTWSLTAAVTASYKVRIRYYREGVLVETKEVTATDLSDSHSETSAGDSVSDMHNADFLLLDSSGNAVGGLVVTKEKLSTL